ncbi:C-C motif chemokine 5-like [Archocentrus centrarchus]|uniref:C-C motif chemokine 5-like n=1 Tax=Archocentrus centrarchus TaxID=63155 RepID=UPI0011EA38CC|nr:C-C motif chemokine 5-like [Archocentrus centrarchus]
MKSITAGLLLVLLAVYCCDASPHAVKSGPDQCCFRFFDKRIPKAQIFSIEKTHIKCSTPAFVVKTPKGDFCVRQTEQWAMGEFVKRHN